MTLPPKRQKPRSGIKRAPAREWPRHRAFVRAHGCSVPNCNQCNPNRPYQIEFAHIRSAANSGIALKPHDAFGISLCATHHAEQHRIGQLAFERKYGLDLTTLAREFVRASPDRAMKESLALTPSPGPR